MLGIRSEVRHLARRWHSRNSSDDERCGLGTANQESLFSGLERGWLWVSVPAHASPGQPRGLSFVPPARPSPCPRRGKQPDR